MALFIHVVHADPTGYIANIFWVPLGTRGRSSTCRRYLTRGLLDTDTLQSVHMYYTKPSFTHSNASCYLFSPDNKCLRNFRFLAQEVLWSTGMKVPDCKEKLNCEDQKRSKFFKNLIHLLKKKKLYPESVALDYFLLDVQLRFEKLSYWPLLCRIPARTWPRPAEEQAQSLFCQLEGRPHGRRRQRVLNLFC